MAYFVGLVKGCHREVPRLLLILCQRKKSVKSSSLKKKMQLYYDNLYCESVSLMMQQKFLQVVICNEMPPRAVSKKHADNTAGMTIVEMFRSYAKMCVQGSLWGRWPKAGWGYIYFEK